MKQIKKDIHRRWLHGMPHHPKSVAMFRSLQSIDFNHGDDFFCWKSGGDGDNGEHLMFEMDVYFELQDQENNSIEFKLEEATGALYNLVHAVRCPTCDDRGYTVFENYLGNPEQQQCEFCWNTINSLFNATAAANKILES